MSYTSGLATDMEREQRYPYIDSNKYRKSFRLVRKKKEIKNDIYGIWKRKESKYGIRHRITIEQPQGITQSDALRLFVFLIYNDAIQSRCALFYHKSHWGLQPRHYGPREEIKVLLHYFIAALQSLRGIYRGIRQQTI